MPSAPSSSPGSTQIPILSPRRAAPRGPMAAPDVRAFRASILHFRDDPGVAAAPESYEYLEDGLLVVEDGRVARVGPAQALLAALPRATAVADRRGALILPGFVDAHIHYSQTDVIASPGRNLLHWLEPDSFPEEARFAERAHAREGPPCVLRSL